MVGCPAQRAGKADKKKSAGAVKINEEWIARRLK